MVANLFNIYLHDGEGQTILGIGDGTSGQKLFLELVNVSQKPIAIDSLTDPQKYNFELAFRPGTLLQSNIDNISLPQSQSSDWEMKRTNDSFCFRYTKNDSKELKTDEKLIFTLENIGAEPAGGSRGTNVELKYQNLSYAGNPISGNQLQYLNIVNQRGSKKLPLYVGFIGSTTVQKNQTITTAQDILVTTTSNTKTETIENRRYNTTTEQPNLSVDSTLPTVSITNLNVVGSNRVLNDGTSANRLILTFRYLNRLQDNPTKSSGNTSTESNQPQEGLSLLGCDENKDAATKFRITFDVLEDDTNKYPDSGYRLLRASNANAVKIKVYDSTKYLDENEGSKQWDIKSDGQGNTRQWIITCKQDTQNLTDEILRLEISDLTTNLQAGYANLYVYYENIPGYWDGHIICPIEKGPLMLAKDSQNEESVGIGTNAPLAKFHVNHKKNTTTKVAYFQGNSGIQIDGTKGDYNALLISNNETKFPALFVSQKGQGEAAHFGGSVQIAIDKQSEQPALGIYQKQSTKPAAVFVGGNVGIGTAEPKQTLDVNGNIIVRNGIIQKGGEPLNQSIDLGLYSQDSGYWMRFVTNSAPIRFFTDGGIGKNFHLSIERNGQVGIGTTEDDYTDKTNNTYNLPYKLYVKGTVGITESINAEGDVNIKGKISCGGKIGIKNNYGKYLTCLTENVSKGAWKDNVDVLRAFTDQLLDREQFTLEMSCSRDLKENIVSISTEEATSTLQQLNPVKYDYKNDRAFRPNLGFIAEEMPDNLASYDKKSLSPFEVTPILTKVVQEQQKTIALLQEKVDELHKKLHSY